MPSRINIGPENGPYVGINEENGNLQLEGNSGNVVAEWDETNAQWDFANNTLNNVDALNSNSVNTEDLDSVLHARNFPGDDGGEQIQNALDNAESQYGRVGVIVHSDGPDGGDWNVSDAIDVPSNTELIGRGMPLLKATSGLDDGMLLSTWDEFRDQSVLGNFDRQNIRISGFEIDGTDGNHNKNVYVYNAQDVTVEHVHSHDSPTRMGMEIQNSRRVDVVDSEFYGNGDDGLSITDTSLGGQQAITHTINVTRCKAWDNADAGFEIDDGPQHVDLKDCHSFDNAKNYEIHTHSDNYDPAFISYKNCHSANAGDEGFSVGFLSGEGLPDGVEAHHYTYKNITHTDDGTTEDGVSIGSDADVLDLSVNGFRIEGGRNAIHIRTGSEDVDLTDGYIEQTAGESIRLGGTDGDPDITDLKNVRMDNVTAKNPADDSELLNVIQSINGLTITGCRFEQNKDRWGVRIPAGKDITIDSTAVVHVGDGGTQRGVLLEAGNGDLFDVKLSDSTFAGFGRAGVEFQESAHDAYNFQAKNCTFKNNGQDTTTNDRDRAGLQFGRFDDIEDATVTGCRFYDTRDDADKTQLHGISMVEYVEYGIYTENNGRGNANDDLFFDSPTATSITDNNLDGAD